MVLLVYYVQGYALAVPGGLLLLTFVLRDNEAGGLGTQNFSWLQDFAWAAHVSFKGTALYTAISINVVGKPT